MLPALVAGCALGIVGLAIGWGISNSVERRAQSVRSEPVWHGHPVATLLCGPQWDIVACNAACTQWLGYPQDVLRGLQLAQLVGDQERVRVKRRLAAVGGVPVALRSTLRRPDGSNVRVEMAIGELESGHRLVALHEQNDRASARLARVSASVREPLTSILGSAELLIGSASAEDSKAARTIQRSAYELARGLDVLTGPAVPTSGTQRPTRPVPDESSPVGGWRVMVVEDHEVNAKVIRQLLGRLGVRSTWARNGEEAIRLLEEEEVDAVLMDCQMPVMDGYEATRRLRKHPRWSGLPIIAVTAHALDEDRERCRRAGMDDHVTKPVGLSDLRRALTHWLGDLMQSDSAVLDEDTLRKLCALLGEETGATVELFIRDGSSALETIQSCVLAGDHTVIVQRAHALKSSAGYVGATEVVAACERVGLAAKEGRLDEIPRHVQSLGVAFAQAEQQLRSRLLAGNLPPGV